MTEATPGMDGTPILLEQRPGQPRLDEARRAAFEVARAAATPLAMSAADAVSVVTEEETRSRSVAVSRRELFARERATARFETGGRGAIVMARNASLEAIESTAEIGGGFEKRRAVVTRDARLSELGRREALAALDAERSEAWREATAEAWGRAEAVLEARSASLERSLDAELAVDGASPAPAPRVEPLLLAALLGGGSLSDARMAGLIESTAACGDGPSAAALLELYAKTAQDTLQLALITRHLEARTDAIRRARLLDHPIALGMAVELFVVQRVLGGLKDLRAFVSSRPSEATLARDQHEKLFAELG